MANNSLLERIVKTSNSEYASVLSEASHLSTSWIVPTSIPALNIALSGSIHGGLSPGIVTLAGESRTFKTTLSLIMAKAYLDAFEDAVLLFYDCEFGARDVMLKNVGIDTTRVAHIPFTNLEELRNDMVQQLDKLGKDDKVFILIDSIGNTASKKEVDDALQGNSAEDMTRAKKLKAFYRIITPQINLKKIPMVGINHVYQGMEPFSKTHMSGGQGPMLSSDTVLFITRAQEKEGETKVGFNFNLKVEKSREVEEGKKIPVTVHKEKGIYPWSAMFEIALKTGHLRNPTKGYYQTKWDDKKFQRSATKSVEFWKPIFEDPEFDAAIQRFHKLSGLTEDSNENTVGSLLDQMADAEIPVDLSEDLEEEET